ncbi:type II secretion system F family protein [bacterium]|nr:type II secretion system F family protein [bacterium]
MKKYKYIVKSQQGQTIEGEIEATSESDASKILISKQLIPIEIKSADSFELSLSKIPFLSILDRVPSKKKAIAIRQFATLIRSGLTITQALSILGDQEANKKLKQVFGTVLKEVEGGGNLSDAFSLHPEVFSSIDIGLIKAGERSGTLDKVLERMAEQLEKQASLLSKIRGAFTYPLIVLIVAVGVIGVMMVYLVPKLKDVYAGFDQELPFITQVMVGISDFMVKFWWLAILLTIALVSAFLAFIKGKTGKRIWDKFKISIPLIKDFLKMVYMARYTRTLSTLVASGVSIVESLKITSNAIGNIIYKEEIDSMTEKVRQGSSLSQAMQESEYFPKTVSQMLKVGEETGEIDAMFTNLANYYDEEVDNIVKTISTVLEPLIIVILGLSVLFILVGIMTPIYSMAQYMFKK